MAVRGSWHIAISITETMKRKAEIQFTAIFVAEVNLTDAKWKKLIGDFFDPDGDGWAADHRWAIESWAEEEGTATLQQQFERAMSFEMARLADDCDGTEKVLLHNTEFEFDAVEFTNSLGV